MVAWVDQVKWDAQGLVTAVAQDALSGRVLMVAWMNREALQETADSGQAVYFSRSRQRLWRKGEESGHTQRDVVLLVVEQLGGIACHTGRESCMYLRLDQQRDGQRVWNAVDPVLKDPATIYPST